MRQLEIKTLTEIVNDNSEPPEALISDGVLLDQTLLLITGRQKARKSFLALNFGMAIAAGESFAGFKIAKPDKVLVLSAEGGYYPNRERIKIMHKNLKNKSTDNFQIANSVRILFDNEDNIVELDKVLKEIKPKVLIIDPLVKFHCSNENSANEMANVFRNLRTLMNDNQISVILVHHDGKDESKGARGSSSILGEYDSSINISASKSSQTHTLKFDMRHVETPENREIKFNTRTNWFEENIVLSKIQNIVAENVGLNRKELADKCVEMGLYKNDTGAYKAIKKEQSSGKIIENNDSFSIV